jgi:dTMP kinase
VDTARQRIAHRSQKAGGGPVRDGRLEQEDARFHERVRTGYRTLCEREPNRIVRIDADRDEDAIRDEIWNTIVSRFHVL